MATYVRAAPWPHATALGLVSGCPPLSLAGWELCAAGAPLVGTAGFCLAASCLWGALLSLADGRARYHEFRRLTRIFRAYGLRRRVLNTVSVSRCQRDAAERAARPPEPAFSKKPPRVASATAESRHSVSSWA